jgi:hypothetical protein
MQNVHENVETMNWFFSNPKIVCQFLKKKRKHRYIKKHRSLDSVFTLQGIYHKEMNRFVHKKTCTWLFISFFTYNYPKLEITIMAYIFRLWHIHTTKYQIAITRKKLSQLVPSVESRWKHWCFINSWWCQKDSRTLFSIDQK